MVVKERFIRFVGSGSPTMRKLAAFRWYTHAFIIAFFRCLRVPHCGWFAALPMERSLIV